MAEENPEVLDAVQKALKASTDAIEASNQKSVRFIKVIYFYFFLNVDVFVCLDLLCAPSIRPSLI
jgi:hypothetical protein